MMSDYNVFVIFFFPIIMMYFGSGNCVWNVLHNNLPTNVIKELKNSLFYNFI